MKILITKKQRTRLMEGLGYKMSYDPSKIDEFVSEGTQILEKLNSDYEKYRQMVCNLTLIEIAEEYEKYQRIEEKMREYKNYVSKKYDFYYDVVDMYDLFEKPDNVKKLDKISSELDYLLLDLDDVTEILENMKDFAKKIKDKK